MKHESVTILEGFDEPGIGLSQCGQSLIQVFAEFPQRRSDDGHVLVQLQAELTLKRYQSETHSKCHHDIT